MLIDLLCWGDADPMTADRLAELDGNTTANVCELIKYYRRQGWPIVANGTDDNRGYFLADDLDQITEYCNMLRESGGDVWNEINELDSIYGIILETGEYMPDRQNY